MAPGAAFILDDADEPKGIVAGMRDESDAAVVHLMIVWWIPRCAGLAQRRHWSPALLAWGGIRRARQMRLAVYPGPNDRARRFYQRLGFRENGRHVCAERDGAEPGESRWSAPWRR